MISDVLTETNGPVAGSVETTLKRRGTLLIVDDEEGPRQSLRVIFEDDYDLLMAEDGPTAVELAQKNSIDVAVLDIRMAGMSGIEVLERLKFVKPDIEAIVITAFETTDTIRQALRLRACDYINKPFDIATIRTAVSHAMQRRTLESKIHSGAEKVEQLLAELQNQRIEEQIARRRGDIYASIIHDINGPLTVVSGFVQVLNRRLGQLSRMEMEDLEFIRERLHIIGRQTGNCIDISRRYLAFLCRRSDESARVGVNQMLNDLNQLVRVHPSLLDNEFHVHPLAEDMGVKMNGTDLIQVLLNLAMNGIQCASLSHRVDVGGEVLHEALDLNLFRDSPQDRLMNVEGVENAAPMVKLWVRDNGPGIPSDVLPKIFQPYFTTKGPRQGTGLGLNIVQRLIKEGHGALHVHTRIGEGTTFTIYLSGVRMSK
ncbi:MAG: response regulator [Verrucomicrobiota bacterium]|jgi:signal transduction histidine kinase